MKDQYFLEPSLPYKVEEYLKEHGTKVNIEVMTDYLIANNKEFQNKKKKIFIRSVAKAYNLVKPNVVVHKSEDGYETENLPANNGTLIPLIEIKDNQEFSVDSMYNSAASNSVQKREYMLKSPKRINGNAYKDNLRAVDSPKSEIIKNNRSMNSIKSDDIEVICLDGKEKNKCESNIGVLRNSSCTSRKEGMESLPKVSEKKRKKISSTVDDIVIDFQEKKKKKKMEFEVVVPSDNLSEMAGIESLYEDLCDLGLSNLVEGNAKLSKCTSKSVLLCGPEGSGKSLLVSNFAGHFSANLLKISAKEFMHHNGKQTSFVEIIDSVFKQALENGPCVLHIENLHILSSDAGLQKTGENDVISYLVDKIDDINENHSDKSILIFGELRYQHSQYVDASLKVVFEEEIYMPGLNSNARMALLQKLCPNMPPSDIEDIAKRTPSYTAGDLVKLMKKAGKFHRKRINKNLIEEIIYSTSREQYFEQYRMEEQVSKDDFDSVIKVMTPALKREGFPSIPEVKMTDIGGMENVKLEIKEKILRPIQEPERFQKLGRVVSHGILLYGPPGCGKTLLAKAIANEAGLNFLPVNSGAMLKMYQGESERAIRENFSLAASVKPCIIFFDEFDCIATTRIGGSEHSGSKQSIVNTLLAEMDGIINRDGVYIMACTNRPDIMDPALLRPGRLDTKLYVGLPDAAGRTGILLASTKQGTFPQISSDVDLSEISCGCENFTGADLVHLIDVACNRAINREDEMEAAGNPVEYSALNKGDFEFAFSKVRPSVSPQDLKYYTKMKNKLENYTYPKCKKVEEDSEIIPSTVD